MIDNALSNTAPKGAFPFYTVARCCCALGLFMGLSLHLLDASSFSIKHCDDLQLSGSGK